MMRPILVTGGTGFVGSALVPQLVEDGCEVHLLARPSADRTPYADLSVCWHEGDLLDSESVERAVAATVARAHALGAGAHVVHGAALISYRAEDADLSRRLNVEGTRIVLDACRMHDVERACLVSSVVAVGFARDRHHVLDEDSTFNGFELGCHYTTTKRAAEDFARAVARQLDVVIVNPGAIFGPSHAPANTTRFLQYLAAERLPRLVPPGSVAPVGVADVAQGIRLALERGRRGRRYLLTETNLTHLELQRFAAEVLGVRGPWGSVPPLAWKAWVGAAGLLERVRRPVHATSRALRHLGVHYRFDSARARTELGWAPEPFADVLRSTVRQVVETTPPNS